MQSMILFPAYGRKYTSQEELRNDFLNGKDFSATQHGGPFTSSTEVFRFFPDLNMVILKDGANIALVYKHEVMDKEPTCECGATLGSHDIVCRSCRQKYKEEV